MGKKYMEKTMENSNGRPSATKWRKFEILFFKTWRFLAKINYKWEFFRLPCLDYQRVDMWEHLIITYHIFLFDMKLIGMILPKTIAANIFGGFIGTEAPKRRGDGNIMYIYIYKYILCVYIYIYTHIYIYILYYAMCIYIYNMEFN